MKIYHTSSYRKKFHTAQPNLPVCRVGLVSRQPATQLVAVAKTGWGFVAVAKVEYKQELVAVAKIRKPILNSRRKYLGYLLK